MFTLIVAAPYLKMRTIAFMRTLEIIWDLTRMAEAGLVGFRRTG